MVKSLALSSRGHGFKPGPQCLDHKRIFRRSLNIITETTELMPPGDALGRELAALLRGTEYMWGNPECPEVDPVTFNLSLNPQASSNGKQKDRNSVSSPDLESTPAATSCSSTISTTTSSSTNATTTTTTSSTISSKSSRKSPSILPDRDSKKSAQVLLFLIVFANSG